MYTLCTVGIDDFCILCESELMFLLVNKGEINIGLYFLLILWHSVMT